MSYDKAQPTMSDEDARNARLDEQIRVLGRPGMTAAELAPQLDEDLRSMYWRRKLDVYFAEQGV